MSEHTISTKLYVGIWIALMGLTVITAGVSFIDLGPFNTIVALSIATFKAVLVCVRLQTPLATAPPIAPASQSSEGRCGVLAG